MRRLALAFLVVLIVATPAFGDDTTKKHQIDSQISSLQGKLAAQKQREQSLKNEVAGYTSRIRATTSRASRSRPPRRWKPTLRCTSTV